MYSLGTAWASLISLRVFSGLRLPAAGRVEDDPVEGYVYAHREGFAGAQTAGSHHKLHTQGDCVAGGRGSSGNAGLDDVRRMRGCADFEQRSHSSSYDHFAARCAGYREG